MASTGEAWRLGRRPALDGVRGIAILLVLLGHSGVPPFANAGAVGVNLFFVLSGFLISALLLEERSDHGRVDFVGFYRRRALRLLPALFVMVAGVWLLRIAWGLGPGWVSVGGTVAALLYGTNFFVYHSPGGVLSHTWSLSLEEQFYLTWPLLLTALFAWGRHRAVMIGAGVLGLASLADLLLFGEGRTFMPDTRSFYLLAGCVLAAALSHPASRVRSPGRVAATSAGVLLAFGSIAHGGLWGLATVVATLCGATWLVWTAATRSMPVLTGGVLGWLGRRSYGVYLWHYPAMVFMHRITDSWLVTLAVVSGVGVGVAALSWRFVETPFLRLKQRLEDDEVPADRVVAGAVGRSAV